MLTNSRNIDVKQRGHCFLCCPDVFVFVINFNSLFFRFSLKDQELCRTISYFSTYCHSFNIVCNIEELFRDDLKNRMIPIQRYIYFCKYANLSPTFCYAKMDRLEKISSFCLSFQIIFVPLHSSTADGCRQPVVPECRVAV